MILTRLTIAALGTAALVAFSAVDSSARNTFCSIDPFFPYRSPETTLFIGVATADSLPGGPAMTVPGGPGPGSVTLPSPPYSQVVTIDRLSTSAPADLANAIRGAGNRALVVPWVYGPDCSPGTWSGKALWMDTGTRGLFGGRLRARDKWVNGVPTFDVGAPFDVPYPAARKYALHLRNGIPLTADALMSLYDSIPRMNVGRVHRDSARDIRLRENQDLIEWANRHHELAARPPLAQMLTIARRESTLHPWFSRPSPIAGTWKFTVELKGEQPIIMFGRTQAFPTSLIASRDGSVRLWELNGAAPYGYYLLMKMTKTEEDLDIERWPPGERQGFISAAFDPVIADRDSTVWAGGADIFGANAILPDVPGLKEKFFVMKLYSQRTADPSRPRYAQGRIISKPDGSLRLERVYRDENEILAKISGERIVESTWRPR